MFLIKHAPIAAIIITLLGVLFAISQISMAGRGSDAAGAGMAKGYAFIFFSAVIVLYVILILVSFIWYRGSNTELSTFKTIYHLFLYVPAIIMAGYYGIQFQEVMWKRSQQVKSYKKWHEIAETKTYKSEQLGIEFQYASIARGTFNTSYFSDVKIEEQGDTVVIVNNYNEKPSFLGLVRRFPVGTKKVELPEENSSCRFQSVDSKLIPSSTKYDLETLAPNYECNYLYTNDTDLRPFGLRQYPRVDKIYLALDKSTQDLRWLVMTSNSNVELGPPNQNEYGKEQVDWFNTLKFSNP